MEKTHVGSNFDDFLDEDGLLRECKAEAVKRVIAWRADVYQKREVDKRIRDEKKRQPSD